MYRWIELRNLQEPRIWTDVSCTISSIFVTVCDNPSKSVLNTLQFAHVDTGQTPEERVAVVKETTHQGISRQDSSLISQVLSNPPDKVRKGEIIIKPDTKVLYKNCWMHELPNILTGR